MGGFDPDQYRALITKIEHGIEKIVSDFNEGVRRLEQDFGSIPVVGEEIKAGLREASKLLDEGIKQIEGALESAGVPLFMWEWADSWEKMAAHAGSSASQLALLKKYQDEWGGLAGGKYKAAVADQGPAIDLIQSRADSISGACRTVSITGFGFYLSLAATIVGVGFVIAAFAAAPETGPVALIPLIGGLVTFVIGIVSAVANLELGVYGQASAFRMATQPSDAVPAAHGAQWPTSANS